MSLSATVDNFYNQTLSSDAFNFFVKSEHALVLESDSESSPIINLESFIPVDRTVEKLLSIDLSLSLLQVTRANL